MHSTRRPSPRVTLPQNFLTSESQAPSTISTAAAIRSRRLCLSGALALDCADAVEWVSPAAANAATANKFLRSFGICRLLPVLALSLPFRTLSEYREKPEANLKNFRFSGRSEKRLPRSGVPKGTSAALCVAPVRAVKGQTVTSSLPAKSVSPHPITAA